MAADPGATGAVQRQAWQERRLPPVEQVRPGVWSIPVPIPANPLRYVLAYLIHGSAGPVLIDTGWPAEEAWAALTDGVREAGAQISEIVGVLITHDHLDHHGLSARVRDVSGCWIAMQGVEAEHLAGQGTAIQMRATQHRFLTEAGTDPVLRDRLEGLQSFELAALRPQPDRTFAGGDVVVDSPRVVAVATPGHTPGHSCFHLPELGLLLTGDHVLPRITPNIGAFGDESVPALASYLDSLGKIAAVPTEEVLPAHEYRFPDLAARAIDLQRHHEVRLEEITARVRSAQGASTWEITQDLTWSRPFHDMHPTQWPFALRETLAHLNLLASRGELIRVDGAVPRWELGR